MKELILIASILLVIIIGAAYWYWFQEREYKSLLKRLQNVPVLGAIMLFFGFDFDD